MNDDDTIQNAGDVSHIYFDYEDKDKIPIKEESIKKEIKTEESLHKDHKDGISMSKIKDEKIEMPNLESDSEVSKDTFQENINANSNVDKVCLLSKSLQSAFFYIW